MTSNDLYTSLPEAPETVSAAGAIGRLVDGLGFRYRWATEGLTANELDFKPTEESKTLMQLLLHIHGMAKMANRVFGGEATEGPASEGFEDLRNDTLQQYHNMSQQLKTLSDEGLQNCAFKHRSSETPLPFWYLINGPIADSLTHVGQISSWRRIAGNPQPTGVSVLLGKAM